MKKEEPASPAGGEPKSKLETWKYVAIGALAIVILVGSGVLFWQVDRQNKPKTDAYAGATELKSQVDELNKKIDDLNKALSDAKAQVTVETTSVTQKTTSGGQVAGASTSKNTSQPISGKININTASASELESLSGVGETKAQAIIDYRNANGGFKSIGEIENVKGIGPATFAKMKDLITI
jgi:comEA protein